MNEQIVNPEKKIIGKKVYTITVTYFEDQTINIQRLNEGFNPLELLGLSDFIGNEIKEQV